MEAGICGYPVPFPAGLRRASGQQDQDGKPCRHAAFRAFFSLQPHRESPQSSANNWILHPYPLFSSRRPGQPKGCNADCPSLQSETDLIAGPS